MRGLTDDEQNELNELKEANVAGPGWQAWRERSGLPPLSDHVKQRILEGKSWGLGADIGPHPKWADRPVSDGTALNDAAVEPTGLEHAAENPRNLQELSAALEARGDGARAIKRAAPGEGPDSEFYLNNNNQLMRDRRYDTGSGGMTESTWVNRRPGFRGSDRMTQARTVANNPILYGSTGSPITSDRAQARADFSAHAADYRARLGAGLRSAGAGGPYGGSMWALGQKMAGPRSKGQMPTFGMQKVLCTVHHAVGNISYSDYSADIRWCTKNIDGRTLDGYHRWAKPLAKLCWRSPLIRWITKPFVVAWAKQMAYLEGARPHSNWLGKTIMTIGLPLCRWLGSKEAILEEVLTKDQYGISG